MRRRGPGPTRDQAWSSFAQILQKLVELTPGALAAAFVDSGGETVDYAGSLEPFDIRLAAAHMQIELRRTSALLSSSIGQVQQMVVLARKRSYLARDVPDHYLLVMVLERMAAFSVSERALKQAAFDFRTEAGWEPPAGTERWIHMQVRPSARDQKRPEFVLLSGTWHEIQVIGGVVGLAKGERGYRVRTSAGEEITLVRERGGNWYSDSTN